VWCTTKRRKLVIAAVGRDRRINACRPTATTYTTNNNRHSIVKCFSSKGIDMLELILKVSNSLNLDPKKCVRKATDGAANMQGEYRGFSAQLSRVAKNQIHIWCYTHVLNFVIGDVTNNILKSINLFGILNGCAVFIKESHKRMDVWTNKEKNNRICSIGETILCSK